MIPPDDIERDHDQLLRGETAGGFAGMNGLYTLRSRPTAILFCFAFAALIALGVWLLGLHPFGN